MLLRNSHVVVYVQRTHSHCSVMSRVCQWVERDSRRHVGVTSWQWQPWRAWSVWCKVTDQSEARFPFKRKRLRLNGNRAWCCVARLCRASAVYIIKTCSQHCTLLTSCCKTITLRYVLEAPFTVCCVCVCARETHLAATSTEWQSHDSPVQSTGIEHCVRACVCERANWRDYGTTTSYSNSRQFDVMSPRSIAACCALWCLGQLWTSCCEIVLKDIKPPSKNS